MQSLELTVKSLDEAKQIAAEKFGVDQDKISIDVIEETKGLFGRSTLRVRAEVEAAPARAAVQQEEKPAKKPARGKAKPAPEPEAPAVEEAAAPAEEPKAKPAKGRKPKAEPAKAAAPAASTEEDGEEGEAQVEVNATDADGVQLAEIVNNILELADLEASVKPTSLNGRYVNLEMSGKDTAYLVGQHGEVLNNLQYLVNVIANRKLGNGVRATLDGNHYRSRREEALQKLATSIAEQVRSRGEEAVLDALPAFERRVIHQTLADMEGVMTYSEGEEPMRRVVIAPR